MHRSLVTSVAVFTPVLSLVACASPCGAEGGGSCIEIAPGPEAQEHAESAFASAAYGDVIVFLEGTHEFDEPLILRTDGVTLRGRGMDSSILSFVRSAPPGVGLHILRANDVVVEDLTIADPSDHGVVIENSERATVRRVFVAWQEHSDFSSHGIHALGCSDVLIEDSEARRASISGLYIRDSQNVIARGNRVYENTVGISVENSPRVDVLDNHASGNTVGVFVYNLPDRMLQGTGIRVSRNTGSPACLVGDRRVAQGYTTGTLCQL